MIGKAKNITNQRQGVGECRNVEWRHSLQPALAKLESILLGRHGRTLSERLVFQPKPVFLTGKNISLENAFAGTACPNTSDPILDANPPGPFCFDCG